MVISCGRLALCGTRLLSKETLQIFEKPLRANSGVSTSKRASVLQSDGEGACTVHVRVVGGVRGGPATRPYPLVPTHEWRPVVQQHELVGW